MLLSLRDALLGSVMIEVKGFSVERFVNLAANKNIVVRELARAGADVVRMRVSVAGFKRLRGCARKTGCKVRIVERRGLPFLAFRHRKRLLLPACAVLFVAALYVLTGFVWQVDIEGAERLQEEALRAYMAEVGLAEGAWKPSISPREIERQMLARFDEIAFLHIQLTGTRAVVRLSETIPPHGEESPTAPQDIVAKKDGLILSIATSQGTPLVKAGDVVRAGDVLVSGVLAIGEPGMEPRYDYVPAQAEVRAKLFYEMEFDVPLFYEEKSFTGNQRTVYSIILLNNLFRPYDPAIPYAHYERLLFQERLSLGAALPLPVVWQREEYHEFVPETRERTLEQAERLGAELVSNRVLREFDETAVVTDRQIAFAPSAEAVRVYALVVTVESIAEARLLEAPVQENAEEENLP